MKEITACYGHFNGQELDGVNCIDFLPDIKSTKESDMKILRTWQMHFRGVGTPYIIERVGGILKLWKKNRAPNMTGCVMGVLVGVLVNSLINKEPLEVDDV